jgi:hypothetical protein
MNSVKLLIFLFFVLGISFGLSAQKFVNVQKLTLGKQVFELHNVTGEIIKFQGNQVLKIERDLNAIPFDSTNVEATVDEPHYARLSSLDDFETVLSR